MAAATAITISEDADAFMRKYLSRPTDVAARLVFADWLEESCVPHNAAWAYYIRLKAEADRYTRGSEERRELESQAEGYAPKIRANLTIPARLFVGYPKSLLQLLPAPNITVRLADFAVAEDTLYLVPESVARENVVLPLDTQRRTLLLAAWDPHDDDLAQKLGFILNREIVLVGAEPDELGDVIDREYDRYPTEVVESPLVEFVTTEQWAIVTDHLAYDDPPVVSTVNLLIGEAIALRADRVLLYPDRDAVGVRVRLEGEWVELDPLPMHVLRPAAARLAVLALIPPACASTQPPLLSPMTGVFPLEAYGVQFRIRVTIQPSPDGPTTQLDITREPAG